MNETTCQREVANVEPYSRKDLSIRSLPDRINDCVQMRALYPNVPKNAAFGKYYSQPEAGAQQRKARNGYVSHHLVNVIQGWVAHSVHATGGMRCDFVRQLQQQGAEQQQQQQQLAVRGGPPPLLQRQ